MQTIDIAHSFACTPDEYLAVIDGAPFHERLRERLELRERSLLERRDAGDAILVRWRVVPARDLPAPLHTFLGGKGLAYVEEERQPKGTYRREWNVRLDALGDGRFRCNGTFDLLPQGPRETRRELRGTIVVRAFGVGGLVERAVARSIEESYEKAAALVREMLPPP